MFLRTFYGRAMRAPISVSSKKYVSGLSSSLADFDADNCESNGNLFCLPFEAGDKNCLVTCLGVPFEATASYRPGSSTAPAAIFEASTQVELYDLETKNAWREGITMFPLEENPVYEWNKTAIELLEHAERCEQNDERRKFLHGVDEISRNVNTFVAAHTRSALDAGQIPGIIGGEHSVAYGAIAAAAEEIPGFGILQIDAHADMREAYGGLEFSHASVFFNVLSKYSSVQVERHVGVGIRDVAEGELNFASEQGDRVRLWTDFELQNNMACGMQWQALVQEIIAPLPEKVWISFDIDGLEPTLCSNTGTPVPGGLNWYQALNLLSGLVNSGREIVGFDLTEVGSAEWDSIVGARLLYKLATWSIVARQRKQGIVRQNGKNTFRGTKLRSHKSNL